MVPQGSCTLAAKKLVLHAQSEKMIQFSVNVSLDCASSVFDLLCAISCFGALNEPEDLPKEIPQQSKIDSELND